MKYMNLTYVREMSGSQYHLDGKALRYLIINKYSKLEIHNCKSS